MVSNRPRSRSDGRAVVRPSASFAIICWRFVPKSFVISISLITSASRLRWIAVSMRATAHSWLAT
jgi:hypothetical protein